jgi:hypothetical protein
MFLVGLDEPFDLAVGLGAAHLAYRLLNVVVGEVPTGAGLGLDQAEELARGVVLDGQTLQLTAILEPVHVDGHERVVVFPPDPRPLSALLVGILGQVFILLADGMDAIVVDREPSRVRIACAMASVPCSCWA